MAIRHKNKNDTESHRHYMMEATGLFKQDDPAQNVTDQSSTVAEPPQQDEPDYYEVKPGDNLSAIAQKMGLSSWQELVELNKERYPSLIDNPDLIHPGWKLTIGDNVSPGHDTKQAFNEASTPARDFLIALGLIDPETTAEPQAKTPPAHNEDDLSPPYEAGETLLNPNLAARMKTDPQVRKYVEMTFEAADKYGLDRNLLANQFWQESKFDPHAKSYAGAAGIAQIMPSHKGEYGLTTNEDFYDPQKSIEAGARMMAGLTREWGDQKLALIAYNGGQKAIEYAQKNLGHHDISADDWSRFMDGQRAQHGTTDRTKWRVQTYEYLHNIDSDRWSPEMKGRAQIALADMADKSGRLSGTFDNKATGTAVAVNTPDYEGPVETSTPATTASTLQVS